MFGRFKLQVIFPAKMFTLPKATIGTDGYEFTVTFTKADTCSTIDGYVRSMNDYGDQRSRRRVVSGHVK